jgi:hypothetical protein
MIQAFTSVTFQIDTRIPEDAFDQVIHCRLLELASVLRTATFSGYCSERGGALDLVHKKFPDINRTLLTTKHASRNAFATDIPAVVRRLILVVAGLQIPIAGVQGAVEGLFLVHPKLKVAGVVVGLTRKRHLGLPALELVQDLAVGHVAHLVILLDRDALLVADASFTIRHHRIARIVRLANVAIDTTPALFAVAGPALSRRSILPVG